MSVCFEVTDGDIDGLIITTKPTVDLTVRVVFEPELPARCLTKGLTLVGSNPAQLETQTVRGDQTGLDGHTLRRTWPARHSRKRGEP